MPARLNLIFFCARRFQVDDFQKVARLIQARAPDIAVYVFETRAGVKPLLAAPWFMLRPTVSIELMDARRRLRIFRGARLRHSAHYDKMQEYRELDAHGLPVPKWTEIRPDTALDPAEWGPYAVVKPSRGKRGAFVRIARTGRVRYRPMPEYPEDHPGRWGPMLMLWTALRSTASFVWQSDSEGDHGIDNDDRFGYREVSFSSSRRRRGWAGCRSKASDAP